MILFLITVVRLYSILSYMKMQKETETEETVGLVVIFFIIVEAFQ